MAVFSPRGPFPNFPGLRWSPEGECKLFQNEEDVPPGWIDTHPHNVTTPPAPVKEKVTLSRKQIVAALQQRDIEYQTSSSTPELYDLLVAAVERSEA